uniref:tRNA-splicing endonuclease subunit Sen15 n=1 Tax=Lygus hesperus TaxID=30085 RepID=A0A0A9ZBY8_LYGHE
MTHLGHPALQEMLLMGCSKEVTVLQAFQTYLELCEYYVLKDVAYEFCVELDLIYLTAREEGESEIYIPVYVKESIQPEWLEKVQKNICSQRNTKKFNLVIRDSDTTHVIFRITDGLVPPLSPDDVRVKKKDEEEKEVMSSELKKMLPELYERALCQRTES